MGDRMEELIARTHMTHIVCRTRGMISGVAWSSVFVQSTSERPLGRRLRSRYHVPTLASTRRATVSKELLPCARFEEGEEGDRPPRSINRLLRRPREFAQRREEEARSERARGGHLHRLSRLGGAGPLAAGVAACGGEGCSAAVAGRAARGSRAVWRVEALRHSLPVRALCAVTTACSEGSAERDSNVHVTAASIGCSNGSAVRKPSLPLRLSLLEESIEVQVSSREELKWNGNASGALQHYDGVPRAPTAQVPANHMALDAQGLRSPCRRLGCASVTPELPVRQSVGGGGPARLLCRRTSDRRHHGAADRVPGR